MNVLLVHPVLGPYIVMINKMLKDLATFLLILVIFIISYGVISTSLLTPHKAHVTDITRLSNVIWKPYFHIYGELFAEAEPEEPGVTRFGTEYHNAYDETLVWILLGLYLLFTNIMLLNLLIAIFNDRYVEVKEKALEIWKFKRYTIVMEYGLRHALFPPFSLFTHIGSAVKFCLRSCGVPKCRSRRRMQTPIPSRALLDQLVDFECDSMSQLKKGEFSAITKTVAEMASDLLCEVDDVKKRMMKIEEKLPADEKKMADGASKMRGFAAAARKASETQKPLIEVPLAVQ